MTQKATTEDIIAAYRQTGSVWKAAKTLGMAGQTIHERLRSVGYPLVAQAWTEDEVAELRLLAGTMVIGEIARRLGRPYQGVAQKISRLGIGTRYGNRIKVKVPRGAGYDKVSIVRYAKEIDASGDTVSRYAKRHGLGVESVCTCLEKYLPEWWDAYRRTHSDLAEVECEGCKRPFIPANTRQRYCTRRCGERTRVDRDYFGGQRANTVGLAEGICQLCRRKVDKGLSSHHIVGKENDPENASLIAVCPGCHKAITILATRAFVDDAESWQDLISLVWMRRHGDDLGNGCMVTVEIEQLDDEDWADEEGAT